MRMHLWFGGVLLYASLCAAAVYPMTSGLGPTPWHEFLRRNDARLMLAWLAALPTLLGLGLLPTRRLLGFVLAASGLLSAVFMSAAAPLEAERLFQGATEPTALFVVSYCAIWLLARRIAPRATASAAALFAFAIGLAAGMAALLGWRSWIEQRLPPDYHDEYAYLFQAWTYLDGRWAYPADHLSPAFEQVHVLHRCVFASRYFPGMAFWMAPFVAAGLPIASMWVAFGLASGFFSLAARRIHPAAGWLTALAMGTTPGLLAFSNALLSTMPTMAALGAFLWAWFGVHEGAAKRWAVVAGVAVGFAFLTRPLSAVGIGCPFALYSLLRFWKPRRTGERSRIAVMIASFACMAALMPLWCRQTLGTIAETPYSRYTRESTPSHVYGFYNVERGRAQRTELVFHPYDEWAENLTPWRALHTLAQRVRAVVQEGLGGLVYGGFLLLLSLAALPRTNDRTLLMSLAVFSLALAYTPYWFVGVFGYGYFAEALPFLVALISLAAVQTATASSQSGLRFAAAALPALVVLRSLLNVADVAPRMFDPSADSQFARLEKSRIVERENFALREGFKLLVLVDADPKTAVHSTLVNNHPRLDAPVVRAWDKPEWRDALMNRYSDRVVYRLKYRGFAEPFEWLRLRGPTKR